MINIIRFIFLFIVSPGLDHKLYKENILSKEDKEFRKIMTMFLLMLQGFKAYGNFSKGIKKVIEEIFSFNENALMIDIIWIVILIISDYKNLKSKNVIYYKYFCYIVIRIFCLYYFFR